MFLIVPSPGQRQMKLSQIGLRRAIVDLIRLDEAGDLWKAINEIEMIVGEEDSRWGARTLREQDDIVHWTRIAEELFGISEHEALHAVLDIRFPAKPQIAAMVLRAWAKDLHRAKPQAVA